MQNALLSSKDMTWCTPQSLFDKLDREFHFTLDAAATEKSAKCERYFTPETDGLAQDWSGETIFCNPPYGRSIGMWVAKGFAESHKPDTTVVMLIPARTDTRYWHLYILPHAEIRFLSGRVKFTDEDGVSKHPAPFPSAVVIFKQHKTIQKGDTNHVDPR